MPALPQVLIKTTFAGLCHSDLHQIDGYFGTKDAPLKLNRKTPFCVGHEIEGEVVAVGPGARGKVELGKAYAVYPWGGCQTCGECRVGAENICSRNHENDIGNGKNLHGGFASHVIVPTFRCVRVWVGGLVRAWVSLCGRSAAFSPGQLASTLRVNCQWCFLSFARRWFRRSAFDVVLL
jgi:D-arabinose 1-dehydrogenase-like Zn-dependent alcohol dehydrogenase